MKLTSKQKQDVAEAMANDRLEYTDAVRVVLARVPETEAKPWERGEAFEKATKAILGFKKSRRKHTKRRPKRMRQ